MKNDIRTKYEYISGLEHIVSDEISSVIKTPIVIKSKGVIYTAFTENTKSLKTLKSVNNIYYVISSYTLNPKYLSKNIESLFQLINKVTIQDKFKSFNINCAGSDTKEIKSIISQIKNQYHISYGSEADLQINYGKIDNEWEVAVRLTTRPLSLRTWREVNIPGGLNPTIAYAMNILSNPKPEDTYLNIFSGSATLLIERGYWDAKTMLGVDINGVYNSYAIKNIKKAGLLKQIQIRRYDINEIPNLGQFDVVTANLPFGIQQGKGEDLEKLYGNFAATSSKLLKEKGRLICYTTNDKLLRESGKKFGIEFNGELSLEINTSIETKLFPKILYRTK